jgi:hypothetical protein
MGAAKDAGAEPESHSPIVRVRPGGTGGGFVIACLMPILVLGYLVVGVAAP